MKPQMILAGDIGGTKTHLALYGYEKQVLRRICDQQYPSQAFESFYEIVALFLREYKVLEVQAACFGIAGPIIDAVCHTTNLPWTIETEVLREILATSQVKLLNDLEATAYGMLYLEASDFLDLTPETEEKSQNRAVIAAGTGLGEAILYYDGESYHPLGSEGGHTDFAPQNSLQDTLLVWLRAQGWGHVSYERILSGPGIYTLYTFLKEHKGLQETSYMLELPEDTDRSAAVSHGALHEKDPLCIETMHLFVAIYGAEAGNLALKSMALGGIYIGGGIAPKILPFMQSPLFLEALYAKGRFKKMLENIKIKISLDQETALLGSVHYGVDKLLFPSS